MKTEEDKGRERHETKRNLKRERARKTCSFTCSERLSDQPQTQHQSQRRGRGGRRKEDEEVEEFPLSAKKVIWSGRGHRMW